MTDRNLHAEIDQLLQAHPVILFMKGSAKAPACGFSGVVCQILDRLGVSFESINILNDPELREAIKEYTASETAAEVEIRELQLVLANSGSSPDLAG